MAGSSSNSTRPANVIPGRPIAASERPTELSEITSGGSVVSLRTLLDDARANGFVLGFRAALETATRVVEGLASRPAHEPLTDLFPESVIISASGNVELLDEALALGGELGRPEVVYAYRSPEQIKGLVHDVRSNLFSLGAIIYEVVLGRPLFMRDEPATTMTAVMAGRVPEFADVMPELPAPFAEVLARLLARSPDDRYQTAPAALVDLERVPMASGAGAPSLEMLAAAFRARSDPHPKAAGTASPSGDLPGDWMDATPTKPHSALPVESLAVPTKRDAPSVSWDWILSVGLVTAAVVGLAVFWLLVLL